MKRSASDAGAFCRAGARLTLRIGFLEGKRLLGVLRALGDPVDHLLFHHAALQAAHQLGVVAVQLNDLLRLFVGRGDQAQGLVQALGVQAQLVRAGHLAHQQAHQDALAGRVHEAFVGVVRDLHLLALTAGLLGRLLGQHAGLVLDQARRHLDMGVGSDQLLAHFAAQAGHQRTLELALQVGADIGTELLRHRRSSRRSCG